MADQYNDNTRNTGSVIDEDDPLAELARIIGYDRPAGQQAGAKSAAVSSATEPSEIDLEAELLGELEAPHAETASPPRSSYAEPPFAEPPADETIFDESSIDAGELGSAAPVAGVPDEPPFDPFQTADDAGRDASAEEADADWLTTSNIDQADAADIDIPEDDLYQALEEELTISEDDLPEPAASGAQAGSLVSDFGDEEAPAEDAELTLAERAGDPSEPAFDDHSLSTQSADEAVADDFDDVFAEWDALVESETDGPDQPGETMTPSGYAADQSADAASDVIPPFLGSTVAPEAATGPAGHDDDILAEMSQFELPVHGEVTPVAGSVRPEEVASSFAGVGEEGEVAAADPVAPFSAAASDFDAFEAELSADLDDYRNQIQSPDAENAVQVDQTDGVVDIEADFDDAAEDFLAEEDFDLTIEEFNPSDDPVEDDPVEDGPVEDDLAAFDTPAVDPQVTTSPTEAGYDREADLPLDDNLSFEEGFEEPSGSADDMTAAFSDFLKSDEDVTQDPAGSMSGDGSDAVSGDYGETDPAREAAAIDDQPFDAFFPQQPVIAAAPASVIPPQPADGSLSQAETEDDDWLASLEAELEEDVAEQTAAARTEDELPEPDMPYGLADEAGEPVFDPAAIAVVDEMPESVAAFDIPELPAEATDAEDDFDTFFESELDREFADLVDAEGHEEISGGTGGWYAAPGEPPLTEETYSDMESDLGFAGSSDGGYRPHPLPVDADAPHSVREPAEAEDNRRKPLVAGLVLGVALLLGGVVFGWSWMSGGTSGDGGPKIIMADKDPVKVVPENPGGANVPNQDKAVYEKVEGNDSGQASQPRLVDSAEEPVDVVQRTIDPDMLPLEGRGDNDVAGVEKVEDRLTEGDTETAGSASGPEPMLSPRRVRTMIVRPDGTIVARPQDEPAAAETAAATPDTPAETETASAETPTETAAADPVAATPAEPAATEQEAPGEGAPQAAAAEDNGETIAPIRTVTTVPIRQAPVPTSRPGDQPVNVVGRVTGNGNVSEVASAEPAAAATAEQSQTSQTGAPANPGGYYVQIASQPSAEGAQASYRNLSSRYANIIGGRGVDIQRADIPNKGVYHRVRIPGGTREEANALCARYKSAGGSCLVTR